MIRNYLKIAWRNIIGHKGYSILNIIGLSIGFAAVILIAAYVSYETSYDKHFTSANNIYRVNSSFYSKGELVRSTSMSPRKPAFELAEQVPGIQSATNSYLASNSLVVGREKRLINQDVLWANKDFLKVFGLKLLEGNPSTALNGPSTIILTQSKAKALFGNQSAMGQTIELNQGWSFEVTGIIADPPANTHLKYGYLASISRFLHYEDFRNALGWRNLIVYSYVRLHEASDAIQVEQSINNYVQANIGFLHKRNQDLHLSLQPVRNIHLDALFVDEMKVGGSRKYIYIISGIGIGILIIVLINFVNLATAISLKRTREIGVRKTFGARKSQLISQHLTESLMVNFIAAIFAVGIVIICQSLVAQFLEVSLNFELGEPFYWIAALTIFLSCTLLASAYPAFIVSSFKPRLALKGTISNRKTKSNNVRQILVTVQFIAAVFLTVSAVVVLKQVNYMRSYDLGLNMDHVLAMNAPSTFDTAWHNEEAVYQKAQKYDLFRTELKKYSFVEQVGACSNLPGEKSDMLRGSRVRKENGEVIDLKFSFREVDEGFLDVYKGKIIVGENFKKDFTEHRQEIIINETSCEVLGYSNPDEAIGKTLKFRRVSWRIVGVVSDFHLRDLSIPIGPEIFMNLHPSENGSYLARLKTNNYQQALSVIEGEWNKIYTEDPFHAFFSDAYFDRQYKKDIQFGKIFSFITLLAIFIANLGLVALTSLIISKRLKEIGVRKVLGASLKDIVFVMSKDTFKVMLLASFIGLPVAIYFLQNWLEAFAYHIDIPYLFTICCCLLVSLIALLSIGYFLMKVAVVNPVNILRDE
jgi:putative ABC transport system permease protein